ncbi:MAG: S1/P1 nuclease [Porticoccaceae bacterium]|nr:S1/P1 nuclease [Porticoccaceae bacterium]MDG1312557.1 S1/P1 nuclease [Porticoccaceae bacterium]
MIRFLAPALLVSMALFSSPSFSFGVDGHLMVTSVAENHLSDKTAMAIKRITDNGDLGSRSLWPDRIRHLPAWEQSKYWHYISIDDRELFSDFLRHKDGDVVSALEHFYAQLQNPQLSNRQQLEALSFFMHFVADIHQPLHVGRRDDRGGNNIQVKWPSKPKNVNLNQVWDSLILATANKASQQYAQMLDRATAQEMAQWQNSHFWEWARESKALRAQVYNFSPETQKARTIISRAYIQRNKPIIEQRILMAGIRLADCLNRIFDPQTQQLKFLLQRRDNLE